jgi:hypothetical protein
LDEKNIHILNLPFALVKTCGDYRVYTEKNLFATIINFAGKALLHCNFLSYHRENNLEIKRGLI